MSGNVTWYAVILGVAVALTFGLLAVAFSDSAVGRRYKRRFGSVQARAKGTPSVASSTTRSIARRDSATPGIDKIVRRWLPRRDILTARLARTGRSISIGQYMMIMGGLVAVTTLVMAFTAGIGILPSFLVGLLIGTALPHLIVGRMGKRRTAKFLQLFPEAIDLMVRALRSGLPISEAIVNAGHEIGDPVGSELRLVESGMKLGRDLDSLLWDTAKHIDSPELRFFVIALSVQRETGGNLAETLANLSDILRRRRQMRAKIRAMSSETRATTMILGGLPICVMLLLAVIQPHYLVPLYTDVRGIFLDVIAFSMLVSGIFIMNRMAHFEI